MNLRVDVELWRRFARAADHTQTSTEDLLIEMMQDYADRNSTTAETGFTRHDDLFGVDSTLTDSQMDLEDYLRVDAK